MRAQKLVDRLLEAGPDDVDPKAYVHSTPEWWNDLDEFTLAYIESAFWSTNDGATESGGEPLDKNYDRSDLDPDTLKKMAEDCLSFQQENADDIAQYPRRGEWSGDQLAGHDFWLTRCGHGTGFWDREYLPEDVRSRLSAAAENYGNVDLYVGDDGMVYGS